MQSRLLKWAETNLRQFSWRRATDPFHILLAEILLQRTRAEAVEPVFGKVLRKWPTPAALAAAPLTEVVDAILPLGFQHRAARLKALGSALERIGSMPSETNELRALPGVGRYVANATLAAAYGQRLPTIDRVSMRVYLRFLGLEKEGVDAEMWDLAARATPLRRVREWNWAVLDLAAIICTARNPRCSECPLRPRCRAASELTRGVESLPLRPSAAR